MTNILDRLDACPKWVAQKIKPYVPEWCRQRGVQWHSRFNVVGDIFVIASGGFAADSTLEGVARASGAAGGLAAALVGSVANVTDKLETEEEREHYNDMPLPSYIACRLKQATDPMNRWRQTLGVSLMGFGAAYTTAGVASGRYSEMALGTILAFGGGLLALEKDTATAWRRMGALYFTTLTPLGASHAYEAYVYHNDPYMIGAATSWAMSNLTAAAILGGKEHTSENDQPPR